MNTGEARKSNSPAEGTNGFPTKPTRTICRNQCLIRSEIPFIFILITLVCLIPGCISEKKDLLVITGRTMGTTYTLKTIPTPSPSMPFDQKALESDINYLLAEVNRQMSTYQKDSEISRFNASGSTDWFPISSDFARVTGSAVRISNESKGAFDITVAPLVNLWGFGPQKRETIIPDDREIKEKKSLVGYQNLSLRMKPPAIRKSTPGVSCDLSAIAKGFGVDKIALYLEAKGFDHYMVEIGGEVRTKGVNSLGEKWRIGLRSPEGNGFKKIIQLSGSAMATSGDYANYHEIDGIRYSHTIDPRTGRPIRHRLASISVIQPSCMMADALATAINVMGPDAGYDFAYQHHLPVYMIIRGRDGFIEKMSPEFTNYILK